MVRLLDERRIHEIIGHNLLMVASPDVGKARHHPLLHVDSPMGARKVQGLCGPEVRSGGTCTLASLTQIQ
jgi:hypothetical protein